jgi:hypothetical protein
VQSLSTYLSEKVKKKLMEKSQFPHPDRKSFLCKDRRNFALTDITNVLSVIKMPTLSLLLALLTLYRFGQPIRTKNVCLKLYKIQGDQIGRIFAQWAIA